MTRSEAGACVRRREIAYLGVGSNLDEPVEQVHSAFRELDAMAESRCLRTSRLYLSPPLGPVEQPDYINAVAVVETGLTAESLLERLHAIEASHGRRRNGARWGPRPLDLDILLYGERCMETPRLVLPHPGLHKRSFVLYPMRDVAPPDLHIPGRGSLQALIEDCGEHPVKRL